MIGSNQSYRYDVLGSDDGRVGGHGDDWIKVPRREGVGEIAEVVGKKSADQCKLRVKGRFDQVGLTVDLNLLLALFDDGADSCGSQHATQPITAGADTLDQRALRDEIDRHFFGDHLFLGFGIKANVASDGAADEAGINKFADTASRERRIVRYNGQIAF